MDEFPASMLAGLIARGLVLLLIVALTLFFARQSNVEMKVGDAAARLVMIALLVSPQIHPWYLLWFLPIALVHRHHAAMIWSCLVFVAYAPLDRWVAHGDWNEPAILIALEHMCVWSVLCGEIWKCWVTQGSNPKMVRTPFDPSPRPPPP